MRSRFSLGVNVRKTLRLACLASAITVISACSPTYRNYGYIPPQEDLDAIVVGVDTRSTVQQTLGSVGASSVIEEDAVYFVRSRVRTLALLEPEVIERQVVAVSFDQAGVVQNIETFGLEQGQIVQLSRRVTDSSVADRTFLRQLFGNIGQFRPGAL